MIILGLITIGVIIIRLMIMIDDDDVDDDGGYIIYTEATFINFRPTLHLKEAGSRPCI